MKALRIGPSLAAALLAAGVFLGLHARAARLGARPDVRQARPMSAAPPALVPEPAWLVRQAGALGLSATQRRKLAGVAGEWEQATRPDRDRLGSAAGAVSDYLESRRRRGALDSGAASRHAADLAEVSARLAAARHAAWDQAWKLLTPSQQDQARALRTRAPLELR